MFATAIQLKGVCCRHQSRSAGRSGWCVLQSDCTRVLILLHPHPPRRVRDERGHVTLVDAPQDRPTESAVSHTVGSTVTSSSSARASLSGVSSHECELREKHAHGCAKATRPEQVRSTMQLAVHARVATQQSQVQLDPFADYPPLGDEANLPSQVPSCLHFTDCVALHHCV